MSADIVQFAGTHRFLSNFWPAPVVLDGMLFPSVEHAYVAAKTTNATLRKRILPLTAGQAKRFGRTFKMRTAHWEEIKLSVMEGLLRQKFAHPHLRQQLVATHTANLVEGNTWGDCFWGVCDGVGENHLGRLLMKIRTECING